MLLVLSQRISIQIPLLCCICLLYVCLQRAERWSSVLMAMDTVKLLKFFLKNFLCVIVFVGVCVCVLMDILLNLKQTAFLVKGFLNILRV